MSQSEHINRKNYPKPSSGYYLDEKFSIFLNVFVRRLLFLFLLGFHGDVNVNSKLLTAKADIEEEKDPIIVPSNAKFSFLKGVHL